MNTPNLAVALHDCMKVQGCRRQLQRLGRSAERLVQFSAEKFDGKRRAQLSDDELILLLYYLQSVDDGG